ncbi:hypothetical protein AB0C12_25255 [Actinoplanes sp. NPDC048967]|uniref:hypothetical protein n=1 Tax=Actinoplanes sp. NPDC048967 TaxID=3155269 RepID=UPI0033C22784
MPGDPHPRSAHRAGPAGGLASLTPQGLVRQAQAGHARARQAIIRQAMARQTRGRRAADRHAHTPARTATVTAPGEHADLHHPDPHHRDLHHPDLPSSARHCPDLHHPDLHHPDLPSSARHCPDPHHPDLHHPDLHHPGRQPSARHRPDPRHSEPRHSGRETAGLRTVRLRPVGLQTVVRLAAEFQAAQVRAARLPAARIPGPRIAGRQMPGRRTSGRWLSGGRSLGTRPPADDLPPAESPAVEWLGSDPVVTDRPATAQHGQHRSGQWPAPAAHQRHTPQRRAPREPQQALQTLLRGLAALIVLAIVGLSAFFIIAEQRRGDGRESAATPGSEPGIASRAVDAEPLTQHEVFPEPAVRLATGDTGYRVDLTHSDSVCRTATTGDLGALLDDYGCEHVVRARMLAPYGGYQVTAGVFNLADEQGAAQVSELTGTLVENGRGTFAMLGGATGDPLGEPLAQVGWHSRGHYLLYCVIARPDGQLVTDDDPYAARITAELVERYLGEQVIGKRTLSLNP